MSFHDFVKTYIYHSNQYVGLVPLDSDGGIIARGIGVKTV